LLMAGGPAARPPSNVSWMQTASLAAQVALGHATVLSIVPAATARRHQPDPAEAHRRWRGKRSEPVRLGVRHHHTRSLCAQSPAQSEQWYCWFGRRRSIVGSAEIAGQFAPYSDAARWPTSAHNAC